jgi:hypothetical protein
MTRCRAMAGSAVVCVSVTALWALTAPTALVAAVRSGGLQTGPIDARIATFCALAAWACAGWLALAAAATVLARSRPGRPVRRGRRRPHHTGPGTARGRGGSRRGGRDIFGRRGDRTRRGRPGVSTRERRRIGHQPRPAAWRDRRPRPCASGSQRRAAGPPSTDPRSAPACGPARATTRAARRTEPTRGATAADAPGRRAGRGGRRPARRHLVVDRGRTPRAGAGDAAIAAEWPRWYAANRERIGTDPDLIRPGQRLLPPPAR